MTTDADGWWATGLADGEGCFYAGLHKTNKKGGHIEPLTLGGVVHHVLTR